MSKLFVIALLVGFTAGFAFAPKTDAWVAFALPHRFPTDSRVNVAGSSPAFSEKPAGARGFVRVGKDGHLYVGDQRIRFLGVNITASSAFPNADDARITADRLARLGINCVRFHHLEAPWVKDNITTGQPGTSRVLNPRTLDRLDRFVAELKAKGIYIDMNLLVSRRFLTGDGLPKQIGDVDWKRQHVIGFWYQPLIALQKEYARKLLTHRNPYTKLTYTEDPAIAVIEVTNESGLIQGWLSNQIDNLPRVFIADLQRQWNDWLAKRYANTAALAKVWGVKHEPLGRQMVANGDFTGGTTGWVLERRAGAVAEAKVAARGYHGKPMLRINVRKPGTASWHVQFNHRGITVKRGKLYTLSFAGRADGKRTISAGLRQAHPPWKQLGLENKVTLDHRWRTFTFSFIASADDDNARVDFSRLSQSGAHFDFAEVSLKPGGDMGLTAKQKLETGGVPIVLHMPSRPVSQACRADWLQFLYDTEQTYWLTMRDYVKKDLQAHALMIGTTVGCSTPNLMNTFDIIDAHAYWQHPHFPGRMWDAHHWYERKVSMADSPDAIVPKLAGKRIEGKPFFVTEFNCGQPNPYGAEGILLVPAYGAMQDWDGIFFFNYGTKANDKINGYFDISGFATKLVNLPIAAAIFRRGDVRAAKRMLSVPYSLDREMKIVSRARAWKLGDAMLAGLADEAALVHRVSMTVGDGAKGMAMPTFTKPAEKRYVSDTGELVWDATKLKRGRVTINTPRTVAVIGHVAKDQTIKLGKVSFTFIGDQRWVTAAMTLIKGDSFANKPKRALLVLTANVTNKGMKLRELGDDRITCDTNWGEGPVMVEPVKAMMRCDDADAMTLYPLNAAGERGRALSRDAENNFSLSADTLWYEVVWE